MRVWYFRLSRWGVTTLGLAFLIWGPLAMSEGWDKIQIERGWSLFIAGAVAASGGVVALALAAVLSRLDHAITMASPRAAAAPNGRDWMEKAEIAEAAEPPPATLPFRPRPVITEPIEVDRYVSGGAVYVMFSDGSVERRGTGGAQRFASLSELRSQLGA
jgi:hypothetical protein